MSINIFTYFPVSASLIISPKKYITNPIPNTTMDVWVKRTSQKTCKYLFSKSGLFNIHHQKKRQYGCRYRTFEFELFVSGIDCTMNDARIYYSFSVIDRIALLQMGVASSFNFLKTPKLQLSQSVATPFLCNFSKSK